MLRALESFHAGERLVAALETVHDHDEVVAGREHLFETVEDESKVSLRKRGKAEV